jgi:hypothetical protein
MASKSSTSSKKVHLQRPTNERRTMCGRTSGVEETDQPKKVTCIACKKMYDTNKSWYSTAKRKLTVAAKKAASATA